MNEKPAPLFLERRSYRQRRLMDAARLLPLLAAVLWGVPLLWPRGGTEGAVSMSTAIRYLFGVWVVLAVLAFLISRKLADDGEGAPGDGEGGQ